MHSEEQGQVPTHPHVRASRPAQRLQYETIFWKSVRHTQDFLTETWWPEVIGILFNLSCLVSTAALLGSYHGKVIPDFDGLTLNTIISILAAASKSSLIFSVTAVMSQAKWCWFKTTHAGTRRSLYDMETFDEASRGPLDSISILFKQTIFSLCSIGAVVVILSLAYDPFIQQLVSYVARPSQLSLDGTTWRAYSVDLDYIPSEISNNVYKGLYRSSSNSFARTPDCSTGNCTWPLFRSAGWCGTCDVLPNEIQSDCNWSMPDLLDQGHNGTRQCAFSVSNYQPLNISMETSIAHDLSWGNITVKYQPMWILNMQPPYLNSLWDKYELLGESNPFLALGFVSMDKSPADPAPGSVRITDFYTVTACYLTPCTRMYNISMDSGSLREEIINEDHGFLTSGAAKGMPDYEACWTPTALQSQNLTYPDDISGVKLNETNMAWCWDENYNPQYWADGFLSALNATISDSMYTVPNAPYQTSNTMTQSMAPSPSQSASESDSSIQFSWRFSSAISDDSTAFLSQYWFSRATNFAQSFRDVVDSLTYSNLVDEFHYLDGGVPRKAIEPVNGAVYTEKSFVVVRRAWIVLSAFLNVIAIGLPCHRCHLHAETKPASVESFSTGNDLPRPASPACRARQYLCLCREYGRCGKRIVRQAE